MKSLIALWNVLANELASRCSTSTTKDINTVLERTEHEGLSFLTITLPTYGKDFQFCLDQGFVTPESFSSFRKTGSCLPSFLRGFTELVFDSGSGVLLSEPDIEAIYAVRQLTLIFSKILLPCTPERERKAMSDYVQCDMEVKNVEACLPDSDVDEFGRMAQLLFGDVFSNLDRKIWEGEIIPKHGPGAVAERLTSNGKYRTQYWTDRLEEVFHVGDFLYPNARFIESDYEEDGIDFHEPGSEIPSRVISVPKTQKTPRIIAIEPSSVQYVQQGILEVLMSSIHSTFLSDFIGTESQEPNQLLAQKGSGDQTLATLDLSEASDRVSSKLVRTLMRNFPLSEKAVFACRSERASVPGHGVIPLAKFASMGSALCFPYEAMVFLTIIFLAIEREQGHQFAKKSEFLDFLGRVRVYGDDLIVPVDYVHTVVDFLESFGAKVGLSKSFWNGKFRESCGKEYYDGHDVSIVKVRRLFPSQRQQVAEVVSLIELRNQMYSFGNWVTVKWLDGKIEGLIRFYPKVLPSSPALSRHSFLGYVSEKEDEYLHRPLVKACVVSSASPRDPLEGPGALLKYFLKRGVEPTFDESHLERAGRPRNVYIKTRWVPPY
ncbi:TPA_asm: RNA-directed RNA polymerase [ssRNA phage Gerhypos.1_16]|uniref:RNA-directed RNA polymerase n=2 Tax=Leviviricetes TaxID=2842243 RepID=A0A8S5KY88_9VIRU|nr:RNA-directed RNA polymerase [ssRNA phage Gerhypos.1_16]QDH89078.1 MAG: RNA-dependent RNA polymerase [Leviviridae sp.]DAD50272.1 TPA_asm: RNA-directed RNA polymerase [ssRNA phage Gerhypos.1_16]